MELPDSALTTGGSMPFPSSMFIPIFAWTPRPSGWGQVYHHIRPHEPVLANPTHIKVLRPFSSLRYTNSNHPFWLPQNLHHLSSWWTGHPHDSYNNACLARMEDPSRTSDCYHPISKGSWAVSEPSKNVEKGRNYLPEIYAGAGLGPVLTNSGLKILPCPRNEETDSEVSRACGLLLQICALFTDLIKDNDPEKVHWSEEDLPDTEGLPM